MEKRLAVLNAISVILVITLSYVSQTGIINDNTMGSLSAEYYNLFTPASYAFAIWGVIFLALLIFSGYQLYQAFGPKKDLTFLRKSGYWFFIANLANATWIFTWLNELTWLSVLLMFIILISLIKVILKTNMERWDAPINIIAFSWWPICLYSGWISVATIANVSAYLAKIGWSAPFFSEEIWTIILILVAGIINVAIIYLRNMREFAAVGVWALIAIYFRHFDEIPLISYAALITAVIIFSNIVYHGWMNRKTNPMYKLMNRD
ncbi:MAG TPA: tryptophan-rich sensory protein [Salegentibacter sp.]|uniref:tryptophan-rich sensory protein n=1 Tax=Salegentibacter sp. TaxID=1903072 RepID=UPI002F93DCBA